MKTNECVKADEWPGDNYLVKSNMDGHYYFGTLGVDDKMVWSKSDVNGVGDLGVALLEEGQVIHALTFEGVGFSVDIRAGGADGVDHLVLNVGYSNPVIIAIPSVISAETGRIHGSPALYRWSGFGSGVVETFMAKIIAKKPASAYKKRGIGTPLSWEVPRKVVKK